MHTSAFQTIENLHPGDHLCCIYRSEDEHREVFTPFVKQGLQQAQRVIYIVDAHTAETVTAYLRAAEFDVETYLQSGQLKLLTSNETYTSGGSFDPDGMIELLRRETEEALAEGYHALRVTGEMTWALSGLPGTERLIEYENKLNRFMPEHRCMAICQYDKREFDPNILLNVLRTHPYAIIGAEVYENFYYLPPEELLSDHSTESELENWIANLRTHSRARQELEESESRYRHLYNSIHDAILVTDTRSTIRHCNQAFEELFEYALEEIEGAQMELLFAREEEARSVATQLAATENELLLTANYRSKGEREFSGASAFYLLADAHGTTEGYIGLIRDITEKQRAEQELSRQRQLINALLETSGALIIELSPQGEILQTNRAAEEITGYSAEELQRMQLWTRIPAKERQGVEEVLQRLLQGEYPNRHQNHWLTRSGDARFIAWTNTVLQDREGGVRSLIATGIDITEHKREDEERIRRLEAEINRMEGFSNAGENAHTTLSSHTARSYAQHSYREARPEAFTRLRQRYAQLLADRMEERSYKTEARAAQGLQRLTEELGREAAGPRDVVELHVAALKEMSKDTSYKRAQALMEEGRLMALELMGNLVACYRNQVVRGGEG